MIWRYGQQHIFLSGSLSSLNTMVYASQSMAVFFAGCVVGRLFTLCLFFITVNRLRLGCQCLIAIGFQQFTELLVGHNVIRLLILMASISISRQST